MRRITTRIGLYRPGSASKATGAPDKRPNTPGGPARHLHTEPEHAETAAPPTEKDKEKGKASWLSRLLFGDEDPSP